MQKNLSESNEIYPSFCENTPDIVRPFGHGRRWKKCSSKLFVRESIITLFKKLEVGCKQQVPLQGSGRKVSDRQESKVVNPPDEEPFRFQSGQRPPAGRLLKCRGRN